jgi:hypothetical protein
MIFPATPFSSGIPQPAMVDDTGGASLNKFKNILHPLPGYFGGLTTGEFQALSSF